MQLCEFATWWLYNVSLYSHHICLHAVWSMAPKCTSIVTLTVNSCGCDRTNYPRHASKPTPPRLHDDISISPGLQGYLSNSDVFAVLLRSHFQRIIWKFEMGSYGLSPTAAASPAPPCICTPLISHYAKLMMHLNMHND